MLSSLPLNPRSDGRPGWEPPILNYSLQLDDEYQKQRDVLLKYYEGDVGKTTKYLDTNVEHLLLLQYIGWVDEQKDDVAADVSEGSGSDYWEGLMESLRIDELEVLPEYQELGITLCREADGEWYVHTHGVDGRPGTESEANAIKALQPLRQRRAHLQAKYIESIGQTMGLGASSDTLAQGRPQWRRLACGNCRKRKLRCSGPQGEGTTENGCDNCVLCGRDNCHFNQLRYPEGKDDESVDFFFFRPSSPASHASSLTDSWVTESWASELDDVATPHMERSPQLAEHSRSMGYEPQVQANEATPLISELDDEGTRVSDTPWTAVFCGYFCS